jgi:hypothetical protein
MKLLDNQIPIEVLFDTLFESPEHKEYARLEFRENQLLTNPNSYAIKNQEDLQKNYDGNAV